MSFWSSVGRGALAVGTLGLSEAARSDRFKRFMMGERPEDVATPGGVTAGQDARSRLLAQLQGELDSGAATAGEKAIQAQGQAAADAIGDAQMAAAQGARGFAAVGAQRDAMANAALAQGQVAAQTAGAVGAERANAQRLLAALAGDTEQSAYALEQYRKGAAKQGFLGTLGGIAGAGIGGYFGGAQGAQLGGQLGYGVGTAATQY
jgi:hypothetical protein